MDSRQYLDAIKLRHNVTDYAAAPLLGVTRAQISQIRTGRSGFGEAPALRIAALLDLSPHAVLAHLMAEKAANDEVKTVWLEIAKRYTACLLLAFFAQSYTPDATASPLSKPAFFEATSLYYVKCMRNLIARIRRCNRWL